MIDVHRCKTALVVMRIPETELLAAMSRIERVVDVEDIVSRRRHVIRELIDQGPGKPCRVGLARRVLEAADGRLRCEQAASFGQRPTAIFITGS
jgi:hypothetical protein